MRNQHKGDHMFSSCIGRAVRGGLRTRRFVRARTRALAGDDGMSTAEYAVGTIAACGFAAVLYKVVTSGAVSAEMQQVIEKALSAKF